MDLEETPVRLPSATAIRIAPNVTLQPPLTHHRKGPGLIIFVTKDLPLLETTHSLDPPPLQKWAEEGYAVLQFEIEINLFKLVGDDKSGGYFEKGLKTLNNLSDRVGQKFGCIGKRISPS